jgi:transposase-like protein
VPRLKGFRFLREIVVYVVWAYHRFALSTADAEDLLAERGVMVSRDAIRLWVNRFGAQFAICIHRDRPHANDKWHLGEVVIPITWGILSRHDTLSVFLRPMTKSTRPSNPAAIASRLHPVVRRRQMHSS